MLPESEGRPSAYMSYTTVYINKTVSSPFYSVPIYRYRSVSQPPRGRFGPISVSRSLSLIRAPNNPL